VTPDQVWEWAANIFERHERELQDLWAAINGLKEEPDMTRPWVDLFPSDFTATVTITDSASDLDLPSVTLPALPTGCTLTHAYLIVTTGRKKDTSTANNALNGAQNIRIKISTGTWGVDDIAAINLVDGQLAVDASSVGTSDLLVGDNDIKAIITAAAATYNIRIEDANAVGADLVLSDVQCFIKLVGTV